MSQSYYYTSGVGSTGQSSYAENPRRTYDLSGRISRLRPREAAFFTYLARLRKIPTTETKFMFLEERDQWQRRNFEVQANKTSISVADPITVTDLQLTCMYDKYGRVVNTDTAPIFLLINQDITLRGQLDIGPADAYQDVRVTMRITSLGTIASDKQAITGVVRAINNDTAYATTYSGKTLQFLDGAPGQVTGSAFAEATGAPDGWIDDLYDREGYTQIFKTSVPIVSGSTISTEFRGHKSEWMRNWVKKMPEHRMDISHACLFGVGQHGSEDGAGTPKRFTWGVVPFVEKFGTTQTFSYATSGYNTFMDFLESFLAPEKGTQGVKLCFTSRKLLTWLNKLGDEGFLKNTLSANPILDYNTIKGSFGHKITVVDTIWGTIGFTEEVLLRGLWEDLMVCLELGNVMYRPLSGNGKSRDTFVRTNVQGNDIDGRKDLILTEAGMRIDLPETHALMTFQ